MYTILPLVLYIFGVFVCVLVRVACGLEILCMVIYDQECSLGRYRCILQCVVPGVALERTLINLSICLLTLKPDSKVKTTLFSNPVLNEVRFSVYNLYIFFDSFFVY